MVWREAIFRSDGGIVPKSASLPHDVIGIGPICHTLERYNPCDIPVPRDIMEQPVRENLREWVLRRPVGVRRDAGPAPVEAADGVYIRADVGC